MSIRCKDANKAVIIEALRRARYKFPGRQKIIVSKKWGFTSLDRADYEQLKRDKKVINDGCYVQVNFIGYHVLGISADQAVPQAQGPARQLSPYGHPCLGHPLDCGDLRRSVVVGAYASAEAY